MSLVFYERVGHEGRRPSPFSWRIRYALAHKQLREGTDFQVRPVRFADVGLVRQLSGQQLTPLLGDGDKIVHETWNIAVHLEERFPDRPSLFGDATGRGMARLINSWTDLALLPAFRPLLLADFPAVLDAGDRAYFRQSREQAFGCTLEAYSADRPAKLAALAAVLTPLEFTLKQQPFLAGSAPAYADFSAFSAFQMARLGAREDAVAAGTSVADWRARMIALFDGLGDRFPGYPRTAT